MWARIIDNKAVEVTDLDPAGRFHPELIWESVPAGTRQNAVQVNGQWQNPEDETIDPPVIYPGIGTRKPTPPQFMTLFTAGQRIAIRASADPVVKDFLSLLDDPRMTEVDLDAPPTRQGLAYLASIDLIAEDEATRIIAGEYPR